jgi:hypothetical protein
MQLYYIEDGDAILLRDGDEEQLVYDGLRDTRARGIICELLNGALLANDQADTLKQQRDKLLEIAQKFRYVAEHLETAPTDDLRRFLPERVTVWISDAMYEAREALGELVCLRCGEWLVGEREGLCEPCQAEADAEVDAYVAEMEAKAAQDIEDWYIDQELRQETLEMESWLREQEMFDDGIPF